MIKVLFAALASIAFASSAQAANFIEVMKDIELRADRKDYFALLHFDREKPGVISKDLLSHGCDLVAYSRNKTVLPAGIYEIGNDDTQSPSVWDESWWRTILGGTKNYDVRVVCQSSDRITTAFINRVMSGYVQVH